MGQHKNLNHNIIRQAILDHCTSPLSANQLKDTLDVNINAIYKALRHLTERDFLGVSTFATHKRGTGTPERFYLTLNNNYQPERESPSVVPETPGARVISFSADKDLQKLLIEASQERRKEYKSPRVHISGAQTYA